MAVTLSGQNDNTGIAMGTSGPLQNATSSFGTAPSGSTNVLQPTSTLNTYQSQIGNELQGAYTNGPNVGLTPDEQAAAAAAAKEAADRAKAAQLRSQVTGLANSIKDIFNSRYGQLDSAAQEQSGKLNSRFQTESQDLTNQIGKETEAIGSAHAAAGSYDSSYRGNNVDTVTQEGNNQIRDLGSSLQEDLAKIAAYVTSQRSNYDAQKGGIDRTLSQLAETTDLNELQSLKNTLEGRIADLQAGAADNNTQAQNMATLATIAPSSARAVQLKTTLSQIIAGNAPANQKAAIGKQLITSAGLTPEEQQALMAGFSGDLQTQDKQQAPTA